MNSVDILKYGDHSFRRALEAVPQKHWEKEVLGMWSIKNIVSHMATYELMLVDVLNSLLEESKVNTPYLDIMKEIGPGAFNDKVVDGRRSLTAKEAYREYKNAFSEGLKLAKKVKPRTWTKNGTLPWYGSKYCLNDFVVFTYYGHKREHAGQIEAVPKLG